MTSHILYCWRTHMDVLGVFTHTAQTQAQFPFGLYIVYVWRTLNYQREAHVVEISWGSLNPILYVHFHMCCSPYYVHSYKLCGQLFQLKCVFLNVYIFPHIYQMVVVFQSTYLQEPCIQYFSVIHSPPHVDFFFMCQYKILYIE